MRLVSNFSSNSWQESEYCQTMPLVHNNENTRMNTQQRLCWAKSSKLQGNRIPLRLCEDNAKAMLLGCRWRNMRVISARVTTFVFTFYLTVSWSGAVCGEDVLCGVVSWVWSRCWQASCFSVLYTAITWPCITEASSMDTIDTLIPAKEGQRRRQGVQCVSKSTQKQYYTVENTSLHLLYSATCRPS